MSLFGVRTESFCPPESAKSLSGPERGPYSIFRFLLGDDPEEAKSAVKGIFVPEGEELLLAEISLCRYRNSEIPPEGLRTLEALFLAFQRRGGSYMLRFLYDWEGRGPEKEPGSLETILRHMEQVGPYIRKNAGIIFLLQGLFIGSWGEMHGSRYGSPAELKRLHRALRKAAGPEVFLSVRTPEQWSLIEGIPADRGAFRDRKDLKDPSLGLFNDGIMGSVTDLGTYRAADGDPVRERKRMLSFQEKLCMRVPNGGEAAGKAGERSLKEAEETLRRMRAGYLNGNHDLAVLGSWARETVTAEGPWRGMDGWSYLARHLGWRFRIDRVKIGRAVIGRKITFLVGLRNDGFAPLFHGAEGRIILRKGDLEVQRTVNAELPRPGGEASLFRDEMREEMLSPGTWDVYFALYSKKYQKALALGNEGSGDPGYRIGRISLT